MPKLTKLHPKGKSTSLQKHCKPEKDGPSNADPEESMRQFQLELCWCIQQLEKFLSEKKGTEKQLQDSWKVLTVLKNNNQPMIRKRQLMRTHFGNYRAKMAVEEKKLAKLASKIKICETPEKPKATFIRKSAFLSSGDNSFRFNFNLNPEQSDNGNPSNANDIISPGNTDNISNVASSSHVDVANAIYSQSGGNTEKRSGNEGKKDFKFSFSQSQFKFNFNIDK